ncbi:MAG: hypothetical protein ACLRP8_00025 [Roseburia intestinalis]
MGSVFILVKGSNAIGEEQIAERLTGDLCLDFGTIFADQRVNLRISEVQPSAGQKRTHNRRKKNLLEIAAYGEGYSNHPIANSIIREEAYGKKTLSMERVTDTEEIA